MTQKIPPHIEFGALPRTQTCYGDGTFPKHPERFNLLPRAEWQPVSLNRHVQWIRSQLDGMCTRNGACSVVEIERSIRNRPGPMLSAEYLYLLNNRWGAGSSLDGALLDLQEPGCISMNDVGGEQLRSTRDFPEDHEVLAGANRMLEWVDLNADFDAVATALQIGKPCLIGVTWPGGGGHSVAATQYLQFTRETVKELEKLGFSPPRGFRYDSHGLRGPNSWGEDRGEAPGYTDEELAWLEMQKREPLTGGWYTLTERECRNFSAYGCWAAGSST